MGCATPGLRGRATVAFVDAAGWLLARVPASAFGTDPSADTEAEERTAADRERQLGAAPAAAPSAYGAPALISSRIHGAAVTFCLRR